MNITLKGFHISTQHAYGQRGKVRYMKDNAKLLKNSYIIQAKNQYRLSPLEGNISIYIRIYFKDKRIRDWDNWHKLSMDSLSGITWIDDSQIKLATVQLMPPDKDNPRIEIIINKI